VASPELRVARSRIGALPLFGGQAALRHAMRESGASAVVLLSGTHGDGASRQALDAYLASQGGVDVYHLETRVRPLEGRAEA